MDVSDAVGRVSSARLVGNRPGSTDTCNGVLLCQPDTEKGNIQKRLKTFVKWIGSVLPIQLAIGGFIFCGPGDTVKCETCKVKLSDWKKDDVPLDRHRKSSPQCTFLTKWFSESDTQQPESSNINGSTRTIGCDVANAKYQQFVVFTKRMDTFDAWPLKVDLQSPSNMALSGFFYIGSADRARCFYCGLTLRDWDINDDPFAVHLQWSPKCQYILHIQEDRVHGQSQVPVPPQLTQLEESSVTLATDSPKASTLTTSSENNMSSASPETRWQHSSQIEAVLAMGFSEEVIKAVIAKKLETTGEDFPDAVSLFCAVETTVT